MNKKMRVAACLAALVLAFPMAFGGCKKNGGGDVELDDNGVIKPGSTKTTVTFWANCDNTELEVFTNIVKEFNSENSGTIEVKLVPKLGSDYDNALGLTLNGKTPPDVFYVADNGYKKYAELNYLYDITDLMATSSVYKVEDMWSNVVERYKYDVTTSLTGTENGRYYGVPKDLGPTVIFYNESYFEGAGITVISVAKEDLAAFNAGTKADDRGKLNSAYGLNGKQVKEKGFFNIDGRWYFNNQIPMSWQETDECAAMIQTYMRRADGGNKPNGYGYFTEWWFNYGWTVGGNCIQQINTSDPAYKGYYYDFTLMDNTANYIVADSCAEVTVNNVTYKAGEIINYQDKIVMSDYASKISSTSKDKRGTYKVTEEVERLANEGKLNRLPSQRDAFTEFVRIAAKKSTLVDTVGGQNLYGYEITPYPESIGGDAGKITAFSTGQIGMLVDGRWNVTELRKQMGLNDADTKKSYKWDVAPLPMYKEYDGEGNVTVHGVEAGHSGSVALCISKKSKKVNAAWKFIEFCGSERGQTLQANAGFAIPLQKNLANSEVFLQSDKYPYNSKIFLNATEYEKAGDWWFLTDKEWIDDWANVLNGSVRNGKKTLTEFYNSSEYTKTFTLLDKYTRR